MYRSLYSQKNAIKDFSSNASLGTQNTIKHLPYYATIAYKSTTFITF
jgi:hypothetical protein